MRQHRPKRSSFCAALAAALAFVVFSLYEAYHLAHSVNEALLHLSEIFRRGIPLATLIAAGLVTACVSGLVWFHIDELATCWMRISGHLKIRLSVLGNICGAIFLAGVLVLLLIALPHNEDSPGTKKQEEVSRLPDKQPYTPQATLPADPLDESRMPEPTLPTPMPVAPTPKPRMADRDVCNLFEDPTDAEWNACVLFNRRHPKLKGTGGPVCIMVRGRIECLPWPTPLPRPRPPL
jgi:hypothetical protein